MDILLVRHGEAAAQWGQHADPGLSELGCQQAQAASTELLERVDRQWSLLSSPKARALETAAPLVRALGADLIIDEAYQEIPAPVPLKGRKQWLRQFMTEYWDSQPEPLHQWRRAILEAVASIDRPTVIYTHFLVINTVVGAAQARRETRCFWPDNASITQLRVEGGRLELVSLGREMETIVN